MKTKYDEINFLENRLMQMYLNAISNAIPEIDQEGKTLVQDTINTLKKRIPLEKYVNMNAPQYNQVMSNAKYTTFNGEEATQTRLNLGYKTLTSLTREIFDAKATIKSGAYQVVLSYETGKRRPRNPPTPGSVAEKYLSWLKDKGYNPYGLEE